MGSFFGLNSPTPGSTNSDFILLYSESSLFLLSLNLTEANFFFLNISLIVKVFFNVILVSFLSSLISSFSFSFSFSLFILVLISLLILTSSFSFSSSESISLLHVSILSISLIIILLDSFVVVLFFLALLLNSCISSLSLFSLSSFNFTLIFLNKLRVCLFLTKGLFFSFCFILINLSNKNAYVFIPFNKSLIIPFIICLYVFTFSSSLLSDSICNLTSDSISFLLYCILFNLINFS